MMNEIKMELEIKDRLQETENGGLGYKSTNNPLVDLNFRAASMRNNVTADDIILFEKALDFHVGYAIKWLFMLRDVREGMGERDTFRKFFLTLYNKYPWYALKLVDIIAEYGRWDDVVEIAFAGDSHLKTKCYDTIEKRLMSDAAVVALGQNGGISLLAKWLPSINASKTARKRALEVISYLNMTKKEYRKLLSILRAKLDVTERKTCGNEWDKIDYNGVCSNANLRYKDSFLRHDESRRKEYLLKLTNHDTDVKINAKVLNPCEIWHKYMSHRDNCGWWGDKRPVEDTDPALEAMWENLKDVGDTGNTMVVVDSSGSMCTKITGSSVDAIDVSRSLGVYFAERASGEFNNKFIEFSSTPRLLDFSDCNSLKSKINFTLKYNDCSNTNIEAVFRLVLDTAVNNKMKQEDMPDRILIISDMEFDSLRRDGGHYSRAIFDVLKSDFENAGYKMPRLVFWNTSSRTNTIPVVENELGVALISGFSQNILKMVMSNETDPYKVLIETLNSERYAQVDEVLKSSACYKI